jgi:GTPase SAR1 family protein
MGHRGSINIQVNCEVILSQQRSRHSRLQPCKVLDQLASKASFDHLDNWIKEASENAPQSSLFMLVGTHSDLTDE